MKKHDEDKEALKQVGREAIAKRRRLGLPISDRDMENEAKDHADMRKSVLILSRGSNCQNHLASSSAVPTGPANPALMRS